ncbi:MAG: chitobiase/beta-hexosaminidase C-terminal domain-containing protein [Phycisphaerae bacterium]|nr:chitobiase/beta-hexosaminidase C-terminal domain-containing protein [Saprospiraceae bacterium]
MKNICLLFALLWPCLSCLAQRSGKDYAIFFVASKFDDKWKPLPDAPTEANLLAADLRDGYGFDVRIVADAKRSDILRTMGEYKRKQYGPEDQLLLFFSMHGYHDAGSDKGYLIPKDGLYDDPIYESWLAHSQLADIAASIPCRRVLVSLDACYSGIFGGSRDRPTAAAWETNNDCQSRVKAAFKGSDQTRKYVAAGGDQRVPAKSDFAVQWHRALQQGYGDDGLLSFSELAATLDQFRDPRPVWGDFVRSTFGDFVFVRKNRCGATSASPATAVLSASDKDKAQWHEAEAANTLDAYRKYLRNCGDYCLYKEDAEAAIGRLKATMPQPAKTTKDLGEIISKPEIEVVYDPKTVKPVVKISTKTLGATIRYTTNGTEPIETSPIYTVPFTTTATCTVRAKAFKRGLISSNTDSAQVTLYKMFPALNLLREPAAGLRAELRTVDGGDYTSDKVIRGFIEKADDVTIIKPDPYCAENKCGMLWKGYIEIPTTGGYRFWTESNDGSLLSIDGEIVVNNDGEHSMTEKTGIANLQKGWHSIRIVYFNTGGDYGLKVRYAELGEEKRELESGMLAH